MVMVSVRRIYIRRPDNGIWIRKNKRVEQKGNAVPTCPEALELKTAAHHKCYANKTYRGDRLINKAT